ncbi:MAG: hypothetical protein KAY32_09355 [Candidatus Eisenbacteria sp.]|nr:hypothetical protein [Candidatus Eisenbacteria bacterium]
MDTQPTFRITPRVILGATIIVIGLLAALDALDVLRVGNVMRFWPLVLIGFGLANLLGATFRGQRVWGVILLILGLLILLANLDALDISWSFIWPVILILLGVLVLSRSFGLHRGGASPEDWISEWALFGGGERRYSSKAFRGGEVNAVFGGLDIDLRDAELVEETAVLDCFVMFGGIDIKVPPGWQIIIQAIPVFGGVSDSTRRAPEAGTAVSRRLLVRGTALFGGIEVKD